jgi:hypothetical protein
MSSRGRHVIVTENRKYEGEVSFIGINVAETYMKFRFNIYEYFGGRCMDMTAT